MVVQSEEKNTEGIEKRDKRTIKAAYAAFLFC